MERKAVAVILFVSIFFSIAGCVTHHWVSPPIDGKIADSTTGKPISGVEVFMVPQPGHGAEEKIGESDSSGHFEAEAKQKTIFGFPFLVYLGDYRNDGQFVFKKNGYAPVAFDYSSPAQNYSPSLDAPATSLKMMAIKNPPEISPEVR